MFLTVLNTIYQVVFLLFSLLLLVAGCIVGVLETRKELAKKPDKPKEIDKNAKACEIIMNAFEEFCFDYCKFSVEDPPKGEDSVSNCENCPLNRIF